MHPPVERAGTASPWTGTVELHKPCPWITNQQESVAALLHPCVVLPTSEDVVGRQRGGERLVCQGVFPRWTTKGGRSLRRTGWPLPCPECTIFPRAPLMTDAKRVGLYRKLAEPLKSSEYWEQSIGHHHLMSLATCSQSHNGHNSEDLLLDSDHLCLLRSKWGPLQYI